MTKSDLELRLTRWLDDGPTGAPSDVVDTALAEARRESQVRNIGLPWLRGRRIASPGYGSLVRTAVGAVAIVVAVSIALWGFNSLPIPPAASPSASQQASPISQPSPSPSDGAPSTIKPSPSATGSTPTSSPSSPQATGEGLVITWNIPRGVSGLDDVADITGSAQLGDRLVISGSRLIDDGVPNIKGMTTYEAPALWWSDDGLEWHLAQLPSGYEDRSFSFGSIDDVTAGGPGFVALGASLPIWSVDGRAWSPSTGSGVPYPGRLKVIGATSDGLIASGFNGAVGAAIAVESRDGREWQAADAVALRLAHPSITFVRSGDALVVFASEFEPASTNIWRVASLDNWVELGTFADRLGSVATSPLGWVAVGSDGSAWVSSNAVSWIRARNAPSGEVLAVAATIVGYVAATATSSMGGCATELNSGQTWTSVDGLDWQQMAESQSWWPNQLLVKGTTLIGIISRDEQQDVETVIRIAELPAAKPDGGPQPTPTVTPTPVDLPGCG
jgi:hypothetical protein